MRKETKEEKKQGERLQMKRYERDGEHTFQLLSWCLFVCHGKGAHELLEVNLSVPVLIEHIEHMCRELLRIATWEVSPKYARKLGLGKFARWMLFQELLVPKLGQQDQIRSSS